MSNGLAQEEGLSAYFFFGETEKKLQKKNP